MRETRQHITVIKAAARESLLTHYGSTVGAWLLYLLIDFMLITMVAPSSDTSLSALLLYLPSMLVHLFMGILHAGMVYLYLNLIHGRDVSVMQLFHGFRSEPGKAVLIRLVLQILSLIAYIPLLIRDLAAGENASLVSSILWILVSRLILLVLTLPVSQAFYLLQDFPARSVPELIRASVRMMRGQYGRLLYLKLSFLPLNLLSALALFLPFPWLLSYYEASHAAFYRDLMRTHVRQKEDGGQPWT